MSRIYNIIGNFLCDFYFLTIFQGGYAMYFTHDLVQTATWSCKISRCCVHSRTCFYLLPTPGKLILSEIKGVLPDHIYKKMFTNCVLPPTRPDFRFKVTLIL